MAAPADRFRVAAELIRQLASSFSSYRLFPDDPDQPGFQAAVERVRRAADKALVSGTFHAEIRRGRVHVADGVVARDETIDRFSMACFDHGIEHLHVRTLPDATDLRRLGQLLALPVEEVAAAGGPRSALEQLGVTSIVVGEVAPEGVTDPDVDLSQFDAEEIALWEGLADPDAFARQLQTAGTDPVTAASDLYARFRTLHGELPSEVVARRGVLQRMRRVLRGFPPEVGRAFADEVLSRLGDDRFASDVAVDLTDAELAEMVGEVAAAGGDDPVALAQRVVAATGRPRGVVDLVAVRSGRPVPGQARSAAATDVRPTLLAMGRRARDLELDGALAEALSEELEEVAGADAAALRDAFPATDADARTLSLVALRDYLAVDDRRVSVDRVLDRWTREVRATLAAGDLAGVDRLLVVAADLAATEDVFRRDAGARALAAVPDAPTVRSLVVARLGAEDATRQLAATLARFGAGSLESVLDLLADEGDRSVRAQLVALASEMGGGEVDAIARRTDDPRWFVVRNLATILGRRADPAAAPTLLRLLGHPEPAVRREAIRGLVSCAGAEATPHLVGLADDADGQVRSAAVTALSGIRADGAAEALAAVVRTAAHLDERRRALDGLARHPAPAAAGLLTRLASRRERPRLPRTLRRQARQLARRGGGRTT